jgi:hypothetical protein
MKKKYIQSEIKCAEPTALRVLVVTLCGWTKVRPYKMHRASGSEFRRNE